VAIGIALVSSLAFSDSGGAAGRPSAKAGIASAPVGPELVSLSGPAESDGRISQHWRLENVVPNSTVTVTYVDQRTNSIIDRTVDGTAFVPESAVDLGLADTFSLEGEAYGFASWVEVDNCAYSDSWERCRSVAGPFFDPGIATTLTDDVTLAAVYGPAKAIPLLCQGKSSGDVGHHATVHSYQYKLTQLPSVRDPLPSSPDEPGGCGVSPGVHYSDWVARRSTIPADIDGNVLRPGWRDSLIANSNDVAVTFVLDTEGATAGGVNVALFTTRVLAAGESVTSWDGRTFGEGSYTWSQDWGQTNMVAITHDLRKDGYASSAARLSFAHSPETYLNAFITDYQDSLNAAGFDWSTFPTEITVGITTSYGTSFRIGYDANSPTADVPTGSPLGEYTEYGIHDDREISNVATCVQLSRNVPTLTGYTFVGWNVTADGSGTSYGAGASVCGSAVEAGDNTLYAQWSTNTYAVVFWANSDGTSSYSSSTTYQMSLNQTTVLPGLPDDIQRPGYVFAGWNTSPDGTGVSYDPGDVFTLSTASDQSLYSLWAPSSQKVSFDWNQGDGSTVPSGLPAVMDVLSDQDATLPAGPSRVGYDFVEWNTQADGGGSGYAAAAQYNVGTAASTLYAQWTPKQYDVIWYESDGTPKDSGAPGRAPGSIIYNPGTEGFFDTNLVLPSSYNSEFPGDVSSLNTAQDGSGLTFEAGSTLPINEDTIPETGDVITLYQQVTWPVKYHFWCDSSVDSCGGGQEAQYAGQLVSNDPAETISATDANLFDLEGWTFAGWDIDGDADGELYGFEASFDLDQLGTFSSNPVLDFYATYQPTDLLAKFDPQGGSEVPPIIFPAWDQDGLTRTPYRGNDRTSSSRSRGFNVPQAPVSAGEEFKEWNTEPDGSGDGFAPGVTLKPSFFTGGIDGTSLGRFDNVKLYAIWKDGQMITYDGPTEFSLVSTDPADYVNGFDLVDWAGDGNHLHKVQSSALLDLTLSVDPISSTICSLAEQPSDYDGNSFRSGWRLQFLGLGTCTVNASQSGTDSVRAANDISFSVEVLGVEQTITFQELSSQPGEKLVRLIHVYGPYDNRMSPDVKLSSVESLTPDVCAARFENANKDSLIVSSEDGGDCRIKVAQDGNDVNGAATLFQPTDSIFETFFKFEQSPEVNNDGVVAFIAGDVETFELDIDVVEELVGNADWYSAQVDDDWMALPNADMTGPAESTTCAVQNDESTVTILSTGNCGIFGQIPGNDEYEDWASPRADGATGRYVIKQGFYIALDSGEGTLEGGQRVLAADGMSVSLPAPSRDGYRFAGWNTSPDGSGTNYVIGDQTWSGTVAATLYAQWEVRAPILATDTSEPHAEVGRANYVFPDGSKSQTPLEVLSPTAIRAGADEFEMDLEGNEDGAAEIDEVRQTLVFRTGKEGIATGRGFQPGSIAEIWLFSTPVFLGETTVLEDGTFAKTFDVPEDIELGEHVIQAEGISAAGEPKAIAAGVIVAGANPASPDDGSGDGAGTGSGDDVVAGDGSSDGAGSGAGGDAATDSGAGSTTVPPSVSLPATGGAVSRMIPLVFLLLAAGCVVILAGTRRRTQT